MRAIQYSAYGETPTLTDVPEPVCEPGGVGGDAVQSGKHYQTEQSRIVLRMRHGRCNKV